MPPAKKAPNAKQEAGRAKKSDNDAKKQAAVDQQRSAQEEADWKEGANTKRSTKEEDAARKEEEAVRKRREKADLLAAEDAAGPTTTATAKKAVVAQKKKKKDDLGFLEDALVSAADKKVKQRKAAEAAAKLKVETDAMQKAAAAAETVPIDPLLANTEQMIGSSIPDDDDNAEAPVGRHANRSRMEATSGIDSALGHLDIGSPVKVVRVTYADFEERMLPVVKAENRGLRLSQYKERVFALWKRSPENPANQIPS